MADDAATQPAAMLVEIRSPTEIAEDSDPGDPFDVDEDNAVKPERVKVKQEKRKRERRCDRDGGVAKSVPSDDDLERSEQEAKFGRSGPDGKKRSENS